MAQQVSTKETTEALLFTAHLASDLTNAFADGHFSVPEGIGLAVKHLSTLPSVIQGIDQIPKELANLDTKEREKLVADFKSAFSLDFKAAEILVEESVEVLLRVSDYILKVSNLKTVA